jgi:hypothetical protein
MWQVNLDSFPDEDPWKSFARVILRRYPEEGRGKDLFANGNIILLDEAQGTYGDHTFWNHIVKSIHGALDYQIKLCLFSSYGSPSDGLPYNPTDHATPVQFGPSQCLPLTPSAELGSPSIGLFYTKEEFDDVVTIICSGDLVERYTIDRDARNYIFNLTSGHPGAVRSVLSYLFQVRRPLRITAFF